MHETITVETHVSAPLEKVWNDFTDPEAVKIWNTASDDWHTVRAENDLRIGGKFLSRMEAKDGSEGFDFTGTYTEVVPRERIAYTMEDPAGKALLSNGAGGRKVVVTFTPDQNGVRVAETFDPETENPHDFQRAGWQAILDNFKKYVEKPV